MSVDTLSLAKELRAAHFGGEQAEAIASAIGRSVAEAAATKKADFFELRADLFELRAANKTDFAEVHTEFAQLGSDLRIEIAKLDTKIESTINKLLFWFIGTQPAIGGTVLALIKLLPTQG